ncbi:MAG TPA: TldD/PmbA family protein [Thermoplasmata archaeon]|nr:TldD/PmbA family protein [Thermoplasmata archaeon]
MDDGTEFVDFAIDYAGKKGAEYTEARYEHQEPESFILKNGVLDALDVGEDRGVGVRVLVNGALGFAATNDLAKGSIRLIVNDAVKVARASRRRTKIRFAQEEALAMNWSVPEEERLADVPVEEKIRGIAEVDQAVTSLGFKVAARYFQLSSNRITKYFANSEGSRIRSYSPRLRFFYFLTVVEGTDAEQTYRNYGWSGGWEGIRAWGLKDRVVEEARSMHKSLTQGKKSPEGKMDLVAGPQVAGIASHESCGHPMEADRVLGREASQAGKSFIPPDGIGMRVGSDVVNVVDDPTVEHAIAYYLTDDEGVKARRRYLYKEGRVTEFLHNRETAASLGTRSNGAARSVNYNLEAIVRMANTFVEPGDHSVEELLEGVKYGIYMKSFMEWNIDDKRYNAKYAGREAYVVENGEIKQPVRNAIVELTTPAFWSAVDAVGKDLEFEAGFCGKSDPGQALDASLGGPTIRLRNVYLK